MKRLEDGKGAITIEAALSLTTFLFVFIMLYSFLSICRVQTRVAVAVNGAAKEISGYSYLYAMTGLNDSMNKVVKAGEEEKEEVGEVVDNVGNLFQSISNIKKSADDMSLTDDDVTCKSVTEDVKSLVSTVKTEGKAIRTSASEVTGYLKGIADDPKSFLFGMLKVLSSDVYKEVMSYFGEVMARNMCKKYFVYDTRAGAADENKQIEAYLKSCNVVPDSVGSYYEGIDFSKTMLFPLGTEDIIIVAEYEVKLLPLLPIDITYTFSQQAVTKGWMNGDCTELTVTKE